MDESSVTVTLALSLTLQAGIKPMTCQFYGGDFTTRPLGCSAKKDREQGSSKPPRRTVEVFHQVLGLVVQVQHWLKLHLTSNVKETEIDI